MSRKTKGRCRGSRNKGYFYRKSHKVWVAKADGKMVPLTDANGDRLRDPNTPEATLKEAHARFLLSQPKRPTAGTKLTVDELATRYLDNIKQTKGAESTFDYRAPVLFDFVHGYGRKWFDKPQLATSNDRIHAGYGIMAAEDLRPHHIYTWISKHPGWGD